MDDRQGLGIAILLERNLPKQKASQGTNFFAIANERRLSNVEGTRRPSARSTIMFGNIASFPAGHLPLHTVLVVEDEVLTRMMVAERLRNRGFKVVEAQSVHEAITLLQSQVPVDLVFTDVRLPGSIDGLALSRFLRDKYPDLKIIVTSGHLAVDSRTDAADAFFAKPYNVGSVIHRIGELLGDLNR